MSYWEASRSWKITSFSWASGVQIMCFEAPSLYGSRTMTPCNDPFPHWKQTGGRHKKKKHKKTAIDQFKPGFLPISKSRSWTQNRWEWIMDAVAEEQNKSIEDWMRNESMGGRLWVVGRGGWVEFTRVIGQLLVWWQWSSISREIMWFDCHDKYTAKPLRGRLCNQGLRMSTAKQITDLRIQTKCKVIQYIMIWIVLIAQSNCGLYIRYFHWSDFKIQLFLIQCFRAYVCQCLISLGGSKVKRDSLTNISKLMNHDPVAEGHEHYCWVMSCSPHS